MRPRLASDAVAVAEGVIEGVGVDEGVDVQVGAKVCVGKSVGDEVAVADSCGPAIPSELPAPPNCKYAPTAPAETSTKLAMPKPNVTLQATDLRC